MYKNYFAFTLAEFIIVLGIIGIIAELTIPSLMSNVQEQVRITGVKKAYSVLSQAYILSTIDNGTPDGWSLTPDKPGALNLSKKFSPYLKITKDCGTTGGCFPSIYTYMNGSTTNFDTGYNLATVQLSDGALLSFEPWNSTWEAASNLAIYADIGVDVNGAKPPNKYGVDFFAFWLTGKGIVPMGTTQDTSTSFDSECKILSSHGYGCTAWVIYNGNQDYLKSCGSTLSWNGPTSCN